MKRKILVPIFASIMAFSMNIIANAEEVKQKTDSIGVIELDEFNDLNYKVAVIKEGVAVKIRENGSVKTVAYTGDEFKILGEQDGWYKVDLGEESEGWVASRFVDVECATGYITSDKVNLRKEASTESEIHEELELASKVKVLEENENWLKVRKGETEGYIRDLYVSEEAPVVELEAVVSNSNSSQESNRNQTSSSNKTQQSNQKPAQHSSNSSKASAVLNLAYSKLGSPYEWGAGGPNRFDCSGFTSYVFRNAAGISIPRTSASQYGVGTSVSKSNLMPGDLVFFSSSGGRITHVGIYVGGGNMIHSPQTGDVVKVSSINSGYYTRTYVGAKRVL